MLYSYWEINLTMDLITKNRTENSKGVKPLIHQSELRTYTKVVSFKDKNSFRFVVFWKILNVMA
jgi:hypothetical protein